MSYNFALYLALLSLHLLSTSYVSILCWVFYLDCFIESSKNSILHDNGIILLCLTGAEFKCNWNHQPSLIWNLNGHNYTCYMFIRISMGNNTKLPPWQIEWFTSTIQQFKISLFSTWWVGHCSEHCGISLSILTLVIWHSLTSLAAGPVGYWQLMAESLPQLRTSPKFAPISTVLSRQEYKNPYQFRPFWGLSHP